MATKCTVIGEENQSKNLKPIEFILTDFGDFKNGRTEPSCKPSNWANIELISRSSDIHKYFDIMFAYDSDRSAGQIHFGWWNDGVVE